MSRGEHEPPRKRRRPVHRGPRRWCIPPAILSDPHEPLEGLAILKELPGDVGQALWQTLREVTLWAALEPEQRRGYLHEGMERRLELLDAARLDPEAELPLTTLAATLRGRDPAAPDLLALLCLQVAEWADARGAARTALHFAQAAALAHPELPAAPLRVARLALRTDQSARAETWLRRSIGVARRGRDWGAYAAAYAELGNLYRTHRENPVLAEAYLLKALRAARRNRLREIAGRAHHGLFLQKLEAGALAAAERHAGRALRLYRDSHPSLPALHRMMAVLQVRLGQYEKAATTLRRLIPTRSDAERAYLCALLARAAAGMGERRTYEQSWTAAWTLLEGGRAKEEAPAALVELARAAALMGDVPRAEQAARLGGTPSEAPPPSVRSPTDG
jgi:tetratricopeptide (TPR) repeat protein